MSKKPEHVRSLYLKSEENNNIIQAIGERNGVVSCNSTINRRLHVDLINS